MEVVIRFVVSVAFFYLAVNWVADNPQTINKFRNKINSVVMPVTQPDAN